jgi:hypothetical protein
MRPPARRARSQHKPDFRSAAFPATRHRVSIDPAISRPEHRSTHPKMAPPLAFHRET